jgi:phage-related protein
VTVEELQVVITANTDSVQSEVNKAKNKMQKFKDITKKATASIGKGMGKIGKAVGKAGKGIAIGIGAGAVALGAMVVKSAEATDRIDKMSQRMGMSKKGFQEWDYVLSQNGVSMDSMQMGMKRMTQSAQQSAQGVGKGAESFEQLGISATNSSGAMKSQEQIFNESVIALQGMEDGTRKAGLAQDIFGKSGQEMLPLINGSAKGVENLKNKANELGLVLSDQAIASGVKFTDQMDTMKRVIGGVASQIGVKLMPIFAGMLSWIMTNMPMIQKIMDVVFGVIGKALKFVGTIMKTVVLPALASLWAWIQPNIPMIKNIIKVAMEVSVKMFKLLSDYITGFVIPTWKKVIGFVVDNYPKIKDAILKAWNYIKPSFDKLITIIKEKVVPMFNSMKDTVMKAMPLIKTIIGVAMAIVVVAIKLVIDVVIAVIDTIATIWKFIKPGIDLVVSIISKAVENIIKTFNFLTKDVPRIFGEVVQSAKDKFNAVKDAVMKPIDGAVDLVKKAVAKIKGFFGGLKIKLPKFKLPHFSMSGKFSLAPPQIPSVGVDWYAKGGVFNTPTTIGVGENGQEAVMPLENNTGWIDTLASKLNGKGGNGGSSDVPIEVILQVGEREFGRVAVDSINKLTRQQGKLILNL